jgi:hypothetical protein
VDYLFLQLMLHLHHHHFLLVQVLFLQNFLAVDLLAEYFLFHLQHNLLEFLPLILLVLLLFLHFFLFQIHLQLMYIQILLNLFL